MNTVITLEELIESIEGALTTVESDLGSDAPNVQAEYGYLKAVHNALLGVLHEFENSGFDDQVITAIAASRIPGLLYLHQLY